MRALVCGGRKFADAEFLRSALENLCFNGPTLPKDLVIIQGGAPGADQLAKAWAFKHGIETITFAPEWRKHGKGAGPIRNQEMIDKGKPDVVIAFPGGKGTADMVERAKKAGLRLIELKGN